jgi:NADP-dependent 3-hydroxy acid dehydrogenase YdfG
VSNTSARLRDVLISMTQVGTPTILINNAGVVQGKLLLDLTAADIKQYVYYMSG